MNNDHCKSAQHQRDNRLRNHEFQGRGRVPDSGLQHLVANLLAHLPGQLLHFIKTKHRILGGYRLIRLNLVHCAGARRLEQRTAALIDDSAVTLFLFAAVQERQRESDEGRRGGQRAENCNCHVIHKCTRILNFKVNHNLHHHDTDQHPDDGRRQQDFARAGRKQNTDIIVINKIHTGRDNIGQRADNTGGGNRLR